MRPIVTLLTDFGTVDGFVGAIKGVILGHAPSAQVVDLTHEIPPQDIAAGARALQEAVRFFPSGTIHVAVVDPGVGTARRPLLINSGGQLLVGPDNGLLSMAAAAGSPAWSLEREEWFLTPLSSTFHGRDVFASVAGHLAVGTPPQSFGPSTDAWVCLEQPLAESRGDQILGRVIYADRFGNLVTNIDAQLMGDAASWEASLGQRAIGPIRRTYGEVEPGQWVAYIGSSGRLEIAVREDSARALAGEGAERAMVTLCKR